MLGIQICNSRPYQCLSVYVKLLHQGSSYAPKSQEQLQLMCCTTDLLQSIYTLAHKEGGKWKAGKMDQLVLGGEVHVSTVSHSLEQL